MPELIFRNHSSGKLHALWSGHPDLYSFHVSHQKIRRCRGNYCLNQQISRKNAFDLQHFNRVLSYMVDIIRKYCMLQKFANFHRKAFKLNLSRRQTWQNLNGEKFEVHRLLAASIGADEIPSGLLNQNNVKKLSVNMNYRYL